MRKVSVCIVTEEAIPPVQRFSVSHKLAETLGTEMDVHLVSVSLNAGFQPENVHFHPVKVKGWCLFVLRKRIEANLKLVGEIVRVCRRNKVDLIYGWWPVAFFSSIICRKRFAADMPEFIEEMYRSYKQPFQRIMTFFLKLLQVVVARKSRAVMVESQAAVEAWSKRRVSRRRLYCAPYGIDTEFFRNGNAEGIRKKYAIPEEDILLMYHGDIGFDDGVDNLIHVVNGLDVWLLCVGNGPEHYIRQLKAIANERTVFTGWVAYSEMPDYLAAADIYVAPFRSTFYTNTTFPLKQMEAMAAGKATVCTKLKAFREAVKDRYDIMLVEPDDLNELKSAILELMQNESLRNNLGENARRTAVEKFDWRRRVDSEIKMLKDTVAGL